jgi:hypothetical protein
MEDDKSLISLSGLSKVGELLIERISTGIGGLARPWQTKRLARAEAEAAKIQLLAEIERDELKRRALTRFVAEEMNKQSNMESITSKALPDLSPDAKPQGMENDWIAHFFDRCKLISDEQMQSLWARVLAGEANNPGTYSKRTVNFLATLDKSDAEQFTRLQSFCWVLDGEPVALINDFNDPMYLEYGVSFGVLTHLDSIGLIVFDSLAGFVRKTKEPITFKASYFEHVHLIQVPSQECNLEVGHVLMTQVGRQLASVCESRPVEEFYERTTKNWCATGLILSSEWPRHPQNK